MECDTSSDTNDNDDATLWRNMDVLWRENKEKPQFDEVAAAEETFCKGKNLQNS